MSGVETIAKGRGGLDEWLLSDLPTVEDVAWQGCGSRSGFEHRSGTLKRCMTSPYPQVAVDLDGCRNGKIGGSERVGRVASQ